MARIGIASYFEEGHVFATFGLASKLKEAGHDVVYLGIADMSETIRVRGFECVIFLQDVFPKNFMIKEFPRIQTLGFFRLVKEWALILNKLLTYYSDKQIDSILRNLSLDCIIIDSLLPELAFVANRNEIPTVMCSVLMPHHKDAKVPPGTKMIVPDGSMKKRKQIALGWKAINISNMLFRLMGMIMTGEDHRKNVRSLASDCNFNIEDIDFNTIFNPMVKLPHLVLCPEEFDFPRNDKRNLYYVEPLIAFNNNDNNVLFELEGKENVVFCSLGSQSFQFKNSTKFLNGLIDIFLKKPDWHLVIALGNYLNRNECHQGKNISVYNWVSQAQILQTCSYMINHGGLGTVKECLYYGVPMISLPFLRDQFGNAARVAYHGVGLSEKLKSINNRKLFSLIKRMENERSFGEKALEMSRIFKQRESENRSVKLIEEFI